jgi:hypothetical protein
MDEKERQARLAALLDLDYDKTTKFIDDVLKTSTTLRGWAITLWIALMGVAINTKQWEISLLGVALVALFGLVDLYHSWLYHEASTHARAIERIWSKEYEALGPEIDDEDVALDAKALMDAHSFGLFLHFRRFRFWNLRRTRLTGLFGYVYVTLAVIAAVISIAVALS